MIYYCTLCDYGGSTREVQHGAVGTVTCGLNEFLASMHDNRNFYTSFHTIFTPKYQVDLCSDKVLCFAPIELPCWCPQASIRRRPAWRRERRALRALLEPPPTWEPPWWPSAHVRRKKPRHQERLRWSQKMYVLPWQECTRSVGVCFSFCILFGQSQMVCFSCLSFSAQKSLFLMFTCSQRHLCGVALVCLPARTRKLQI